MEQVVEMTQEKVEADEQQQVVELSLEMLGLVGGGGAAGVSL